MKGERLTITFRCIESVFEDAEDGLVISGTALIPMISRNENLYTKKEIAGADGGVVPVNWEHNMVDKFRGETLGNAKFTWDGEKTDLKYRALITHDEAAREIRDADWGELYVSIEATVDKTRYICNAIEGDCFNMPSGLVFIGLAITKNPGITHSSLMRERKMSQEEADSTIKALYSIKPYIQTPDYTPTMAAQTPAAAENTLPEGFEVKNGIPVAVSDAAKAAVAKATEASDSATPGASNEKPSEQMCSNNQKFDGGKCVGADNVEAKTCPSCSGEAAAAPAAAPPAAAPPAADPPAEAATESANEGEPAEKNLAGTYPNADRIHRESVGTIGEARAAAAAAAPAKAVESKPAEAKENMSQDEFETMRYAVTQITSDKNGGFLESDIKTLGKRAYAALHAGQNFSYEQRGLHDWAAESAASYVGMNDHNLFPVNKQGVSEAINYTNGADLGDRRAVMGRTRVAPGGKYLKSIRDMVIADDIPDGVTEITRVLGDIPDARNLTEGTAGNAYGTHTIDVKKLAANQVTGVPQFVEMSKLENSPQPVFEYLVTAARASMLDYEARLVFDTAADTLTASTLGGWRRGDGQVITDDDAANLGEFKFEALVDVLSDIQTEGYDTSMGQVKCVLHPRQLAQLKKDPNIQRYIQQGDARIARTGDLAYFGGIELIPMNAVGTVGTAGGRSNDAYRATVFLDQYSFWFASHRDLTVNMQLRPNLIGFDQIWTQRKNAAVYDGKSVFRISTSV